MIILGAGMAGCLAGLMFPKAMVLEAQSSIPNNHSAVLRFRSDNISRATGIPFQRIMVHKGIWHNGKAVEPSIKLVNMYAWKVTGGSILPRSISSAHFAPQERWIAPLDFHTQLASMLADRLKLGHKIVDFSNGHIGVDTPEHALTLDAQMIISTIPMPVMMGVARDKGVVEGETFEHKSIHITQYNLPKCNVHQTIYYPQQESSIYRATLDGSLLIVESMGELKPEDEQEVLDSFGIGGIPYIQRTSQNEQCFGKIVPIDDANRKAYLHHLTTKYGVYSLGRFACWREGVMMDDVYRDIEHIRSMMYNSEYDNRRGGQE